MMKQKNSNGGKEVRSTVMNALSLLKKKGKLQRPLNKGRGSGRRGGVALSTALAAPVAVTAHMKIVPFHACGKNRYCGVEEVTPIYVPNAALATFYQVLGPALLLPNTSILWPKANTVANLFLKFRVVRSRLVYMPSSQTGTNTQVAMLYVGDPSAYVSQPTSLQAASQYGDFAQSAAYQPCEVSSRRINATKVYFTGGSTGEDLRFETPGAYSVFVDQADAASAGKLIGYVYHDYELEYLDPQPPNTASVSFIPASIGYTPTPSQQYYDLPLQVLTASSYGPQANGLIMSNNNWQSSEIHEWVSRPSVPNAFNPVVPNTNASISGLVPAGGFGSVPTIPGGSSFTVTGTLSGTITYPPVPTMATATVSIILFSQSPAQQAANTYSFTVVFSAGLSVGSTFYTFSNTFYKTFGTITGNLRVWAALEVNYSIGPGSGYPLNYANSALDLITYQVAPPYPVDGIARQISQPVGTQYDLQSQTSLWQPQFEAGSAGVVVIFPPGALQEHKEATLRRLQELVDLCQKEMKMCAPLVRSGPDSSDEKEEESWVTSTQPVLVEEIASPKQERNARSKSLSNERTKRT